MDNQELIQNVYAKNVEQNIIHISDAKSGRQGYFCLGCDRPMQAVKQSKINRISYFRHDHNASAGEAKCTYKDETYRHKIAKEYLINFKKVKVPSLYKYPPKGSEGIANLIFKEKYIEASFVMPELSFYEDENGEIHFEKNLPRSENNFLLLKPDITFFDANAKPILLIELIATHKLTEEKKLSLKRLGIDTIQITIPKDSPESIEQVFEKTNRTKWIYNYEQENTDYIPISIPDSEGVSSIDENQRKLFEESFKCRVSQIGNLIRSINRCLASEQFGTIAGDFESEISRVTRNTETERDDLEKVRREYPTRIEELRDRIRTKINTRYQVDIDRIHSERARLDAEEQQLQEFIVKEEEEFTAGIEEHRNRVKESISGESGNDRKERERRYTDLEKRYLARRTELIGQRTRIQDSKGELRDEISKIERDYKREQTTNIEIRTKEYNINDTIAKEERMESQERAAFDGTAERRDRLEGRRSKIRTEIEERVEQLRGEFVAAIESRDFIENEYTKRYKEQIIDLEIIPNYIDAKRTYERYEKAWKCFKDAAYENWNE